jgi:DNA mismatch repair protein MutL
VTATRSPIRLLPEAVAARIAAGEVVERPASVVKELVENALDAGAGRVRIDVRGGGLLQIRVGDDGSGIPAEELPLAVQRHATSKLAGDDLARVRTLGFRGEALPSIAAVAELTVVSADGEDGVGRRLVVRAGRLIRDEPAPQPRGTTVTVRGLFEEMPARLAASRRAQTEIAQIGQTVRRLALAATTTRFTLVVDDRPTLRTSGSGDLATTLTEIYGAALAGSLLPLGPVELPNARLRGVVSGPELTRPGRGQLHVTVNGRAVQPRGLLAHIETAYRPLLPRGRHPILAVVIDAAPDRVDINIHPAKLEVRLLDEAAIGAALGDLLRGALGRRPQELSSDHWAAIGGALLTADHWTQPAVREEGGEWDDARPIVTPNMPPLRLIGQIQDRLLLLEGPAGLYLVDQHRSHERILYERLRAAHGGAGPESVALPEPLLIELRPSQVARFGRRLDALAALGFQCEVFGGRSFLLRAAPALPGVTSAEATALSAESPESDSVLSPQSSALAGLGVPEELAATLLALGDEEAAEGEDWQERLLVSLSCRTAVRRGRPLARAAMRALVEALGHTSAPAVCPHGSPLLMHVSGTVLERQFGWR